MVRTCLLREIWLHTNSALRADQYLCKTVTFFTPQRKWCGLRSGAALDVRTLTLNVGGPIFAPSVPKTSWDAPKKQIFIGLCKRPNDANSIKVKASGRFNRDSALGIRRCCRLFGASVFIDLTCGRRTRRAGSGGHERRSSRTKLIC